MYDGYVRKRLLSQPVAPTTYLATAASPPVMESKHDEKTQRIYGRTGLCPRGGRTRKPGSVAKFYRTASRVHPGGMKHAWRYSASRS